MSKTPYEATLEFIRKRVAKEKDKYYSGVKNDFFLWEDYENTFNSSHEMYLKYCEENYKRLQVEREAMKKKGEI